MPCVYFSHCQKTIAPTHQRMPKAITDSSKAYHFLNVVALVWISRIALKRSFSSLIIRALGFLEATFVILLTGVVMNTKVRCIGPLRCFELMNWDGAGS